MTDNQKNMITQLLDELSTRRDAARVKLAKFRAKIHITKANLADIEAMIEELELKQSGTPPHRNE
jgi:hypothetical protein